MTTLNISLPEAMKEFVEAEVAAGGYSTASEYVRELIRSARKQRAQERVEALLEEGLRSEPMEMTHADWDELKRSVSDRSRKRKAR